MRVGRFGWKADTPTLAHFVGGGVSQRARADEPARAGVRAGARPGRPCGQQSARPRSTATRWRRGRAFVASLPAPAPLPGATAGEAVFRQTGCAACHVPALAHATREVPLYSDLLLHDMGRALDDRVDQATATGRDWRTPPLWGLSRRTRFLHDGRAQSLEAAILAHGGEARRARQRFRALSAADRRR